MVVYLRWKFVDLKDPKMHCVNYRTYLLGSASAFGCMGVGAFQSSNGTKLHLVWAFLNLFGFQTYILIHTWYIDPRIERADAEYKRGFLRCLVTITGSICWPLSLIFDSR